MNHEDILRLMEDPDEDVLEAESLSAAVLKSGKVIRHLKAKRGRRAKRVPKPIWLDKALHMIQAGAAEVNLIRLANEDSMGDKLVSLITHVQTLLHVVTGSVE